MKKRGLILLPLLPLLTSCHGIVISNEDALEILNKIESSIDESVPFENFSYIHKTVSEESTVEARSFYNKKSRFYYTFEILSGTKNELSEKWVYTRIANDEFHIYEIVRDTSGAIDPGDSPQYKITNDISYASEEKLIEGWSKYEEGYISDIVALYKAALINSKSFIDNQDIDVNFYSYGSNSIYVDANQKIEMVESTIINYKYSFEGNRLTYQERDDSKVNETYTYSYGKVETNYPNVDYDEYK